MNSWRSWVVFAGAVIVYLIAVTQRTTFGIVGVEATDRFGVSAATLSSVAVVQVATYAALQIPVGVLVDRLVATLGLKPQPSNLDAYRKRSLTAHSASSSKTAKAGAPLACPAPIARRCEHKIATSSSPTANTLRCTGGCM